MAKKAAPKKEQQETQEQKVLEFKMIQPDGSEYLWKPTPEMDQLALKAFDDSYQMTQEQANDVRDYIEKGICQCMWGVNKKVNFQSEEQKAIFALWFNDKSEESRRLLVLGKDRIEYMLKTGKAFEEDAEETLKSPASSGVGSSGLHIEVQNNGGTSSTKIETEDDKKEEQKMMNNNEQAQQQQEKGLWEKTKENAVPLATGAAVGIVGTIAVKKVFFDDDSKESSYGSVAGDLMDSAVKVDGMLPW